MTLVISWRRVTKIPIKKLVLSVYVIALILALISVGGRRELIAVTAVAAIFFITGALVILLVDLESHTPEHCGIVLCFANIRRGLAVPVPKKRNPQGEWRW
jgi:hypothetical protein